MPTHLRLALAAALLAAALLAAVPLAAAPSLALAAEALPNGCPELTALQRAAGYVDLIGALKVFGVLLIGGGILFIFSGVLQLFFSSKRFVQASAWATTLVLLSGWLWLPTSLAEWLPWFVSVGSLTLYGAFCAVSTDPRRDLPSWGFNLALAVAWAAIAVFYDNALAGFLCVAASMAAIGFSVAVTPLCYAFGFKDDSSVWRGVGAGLAAVAAYAAMRAFGYAHPSLAVFEPGALWLGGFVAGVGMLIVSSRWYKKDCLATTLASIATMVIGILVGSAYGVREVTTLFTAFLILLVAAKIVEIPTREMVGFGVKLIAAGGIVGGAWHWLSSHPEFAAKFLLVG